MWHRTDNFRQGRVHPMCNVTGTRDVTLGQNVLTYDQRHTSVATDFTMGFGEIISANPRDRARGATSATRRPYSR